MWRAALRSRGKTSKGWGLAVGGLQGAQFALSESFALRQRNPEPSGRPEGLRTSSSMSASESGATGRSAAGRKHALRFYEDVDVVETVVEAQDAGGPHGVSGGRAWQVTLDGNVLNTPKHRRLLFPARALALAVACEWEQQGSTIKPFTMPLMTLAATAADQVRGIESKVALAMADYLDTDQVCFREPLVARDGPPRIDVPDSLMGRVSSTQADRAQRLRDEQARWCDPIVTWATKRFGQEVALHEGVMSYGQGQELHAAVRAYLENLGAERLTGVEAIVSTSKSMLLGLALAEGAISVDHAVRACRVEEDFQMHEWGLVEGGHDLDTSGVAASLHAPALWIQLHRAAAQEA